MKPGILPVNKQEYVNLFSDMMRKIYENGKPDGCISRPVSDMPVDKVIERTIEPGFSSEQTKLAFNLKIRKESFVNNNNDKLYVAAIHCFGECEKFPTLSYTCTYTLSLTKPDGTQDLAVKEEVTGTQGNSPSNNLLLHITSLTPRLKDTGVQTADG